MGLHGHHIGVIASSRNDQLWTNLTRWWKMTETSGDIIEYAVGGGAHDGTIGGGATQSSSGIVYDGAADWSNQSIGTLGTDDFTIIMRINPTSGYGNRSILGGTSCFQLIYDTSFGLFAGIDGGSVSSATSITMNTGSVNMIAVVRSGNTFRFFINGSFEDETLTANFTGNTSFVAGSNTTYSSRFVGTVRDLAVFSDAKSDAYITAFYNSGSYTEYDDGDPI